VASTQAWPSGQDTPQAPQFQASLRRSAQPPPQGLAGPQLSMQADWAQIWPAAHTLPQPPQLLRSLLVLAGRPLQFLMGGVPAKARHCPWIHVVPDGQVLPIVPQLFSSDAVATQVALTRL
jgi:hypothetical protein